MLCRRSTRCAGLADVNFPLQMNPATAAKHAAHEREESFRYLDFPPFFGNIENVSFRVLYFIFGESDSRKRLLNLDIRLDLLKPFSRSREHHAVSDLPKSSNFDRDERCRVTREFMPKDCSIT
jgi:hypothetical protein